ncbi:hypothetical protein KAJ83_10015 [Marivibrio halodurans]|uniref:Transmembrane transcriptional regulator (Anti-sigma factor RsiW) n=1 Tax=Marivibrio halodurans TaxID=2039722 RepID=A0A8J7SMD8_9PROT|nr:hypothetical protein [Marivibrio halodurans]MBP5857343.1 hypothetical protein [Marivibrio halodurans]
MTRDDRDTQETERWRRLCAFVDGELQGREAADLARSIAENPADARDAAMLGAVKGSVAEALTPMDDRIPRVPPTPGARSGHPRISLVRRMLAASILLLLVAGSGWIAVQNDGAPPTDAAQMPPWIETALAQHAVLSREAEAAPPPATRGTPIATDGFSPFIPRLDAGQLHIVRRMSFAGPSGHQGVAVHYRGNRGCKLTLAALDDGAGNLGEALERREFADTTLLAWRVGRVRYMLMASGMEPARLSVIARAVHDASQRHREIDGADRERIADARRRSQPCRA